MNQSLTREEIVAFRERLRDMHDKLVEEVRQELLQSDNERYIELAGVVHDSGEESVADLLTDVATVNIDRHVTEIRDIELALERIATGNYGLCTDCNEPVARERLEVYPAARRCYQCQQHFEQTHAETGGHTL